MFVSGGWIRSTWRRGRGMNQSELESPQEMTITMESRSSSCPTSVAQVTRNLGKTS